MKVILAVMAASSLLAGCSAALRAQTPTPNVIVDDYPPAHRWRPVKPLPPTVTKKPETAALPVPLTPSTPTPVASTPVPPKAVQAAPTPDPLPWTLVMAMQGEDRVRRVFVQDEATCKSFLDRKGDNPRIILAMCVNEGKEGKKVGD